MTPTLVGRWQTRIATLAVIGVLISALFLVLVPEGPFFWVLAYVLAFGLVWDVIYIAIQRLRWDRDWPAAFQVGTGIFEGLWIYLLATFVVLPGITGPLDPVTFIGHYGLVWLAIFVVVQGPLRVLFPFWRFHGGRLAPAVSSRQRRR